MGGKNELDVLEGTNITPGQLHDTCIVLLGHAIGRPDGGVDVGRLRELIRPVFEAIGAIPYDAQPRGPYGRPAKTSSEGGEPC